MGKHKDRSKAMCHEKSLLPVNIRPFGESDNRQLIDLAKSIGVPARVRLGIDRSPVFWRFDQKADAKYDILVAEVDHRIIGFIDMMHTEFVVCGVKRSVTYVGLAGVDVGWRGSTVFVRLLRASEKTARAHGSELAIALVNENNERLDRLLQLVYKDSIRCEKLRILCILLGPYYRYRRDFLIEAANPEDFPRIIQLVNRHYARYQIAPIIRDTHFKKLFRNELNDFLVARDEGGNVVATLGLWDQSSFRRTLVAQYALPELWIRILLNSMRHFTHTKRLPDPGGHLSYLHSIYAASEAGYEDAFATLVRFACNRYAQRQHHFLILSSPEYSQFDRCSRGLWRIVNTNIPVVVPLTPRAVRFLKGGDLRNLYLEYIKDKEILDEYAEAKQIDC